MKGYKYRSKETFERDLATILNNQIFASSFGMLNDRFEGTYREEISLFINMFRTIGVDSKDISKYFNEIQAYLERLGVYSLSTSFSNELMWSHYSSAHKGFCIEYEIEKLKVGDLDNNYIRDVKVDYRNEIPVLTLSDINSLDTVVKKMFGTKSLIWEYEKEIRLIFDNYSLKNHHPSALTGIYFGIEMSDEHKRIIIDSLTNRDIKFYQLFKEPYSYQIMEKLIYENKRLIKNKLDPNSFEILKTKHNLIVENFYVLYKSPNLDELSLKAFLEGFRENFSTKNSTINLFDNQSILDIIDKYPLNKDEYLKYADCFVAESNFETPDLLSMYPYQDIQYKEYGGMNWKKSLYQKN